MKLEKCDQGVVLEALHNCIAHQDYSRHSRILLTERLDPLILENAGSFCEGSPMGYALTERTSDQYRSFVNIGGPDIVIRCDDTPVVGSERTVQVEIRGLDIDGPIKGEIKSRAAHDIAYWLIDDDCDGTNFVVHQIFFCEGGKASTNKRPGQKIAVLVISQFGEEMTKVMEV